ncbi:hypothetical protein BGZ76_011142, partial [Entomortierella beljakovae]
AIQHSQLNIKETKNGFLAIEVEINNERKLVSPEEITAVLFKEIKEWSKATFTSKEDLVATVSIPDNTNDHQTRAVKDAGTIAGLTIWRVQTAARAAVYAYRLQEEEAKFIVFHLGGNSLQVTLVDCDDGIVDILEEIETRLGGSDFNQRVVDYFVEKYKEAHDSNNISKNPLVLDKLRRQVEKAKIALSNSTLAHVEIHDPFFGDNNNNNTFHEILTREIFEQLNQDLFDRSIQYIDDLLLKANVTKQDIGGVVLTGGSLHIPKLSMLVEGYFKGKTIYNKIDPIDVVAYGSGVMDRSEFWEYYEVSISLLPLVDISLGVEASGGVMTKILTRNIALPVRRSLIFSTATDNQTSVKIRIFQGERILTMHNILVDEFNLTGIHPAPRGTALIEVTFEIGANEVLRVTAKDLHSGLSASIFPLVPNFSYDAANYYDRITIPLKRDKTKDVIIKEQITSQCITVDDPDLEEKLSKQVIWGLPDSDSYDQKFDYLLAIDLGSTNTVATINTPDLSERYKVLAHQEARIIIPSIVAFTNNGTLVGERARDQYVSNPTNTIMDVRRFLGRRFNDPIVQDAIQHSQLNIKETKNGFLAIEVEINNERKLVSPEEITAVLFKEIKEWSKATFTSKEDLVATVSIPDNTNDHQTRAVKDAGTIAGLTIWRVQTAARAAVYAYRLQEEEAKFIVFHLGGNSLQVTLVDCDDGIVDILEEIETRLGGSDFNQRVVDYFVEKYKEAHDSNNISKNPLVLDKLRRQVEKAKIALSNSTLAHVEIHDRFFGDNGNNIFHEILTREIFEQLNQDLFDRSIQYIDDLLLKANITKQDIKGVVFSGGSILIPKLSMLIEEYFKGKDIHNMIDPIDVVTYGSAGTISGLIWPKIYCYDTSLDVSFGVEASRGVMTKILPRNIALPVRRSLIFSTATENQTSVKIRIFQGEQILTKHNTFVHEFNLTGIQPAPRGTSLIEVTFEIDVNRLFKVSAKDLQSNISTNAFFRTNQMTDGGAFYDVTLDEKEDAEIKEHINSQCTIVNDPVLENRLESQNIWGHPDCKIILLEPVDENSSYTDKPYQYSEGALHDEL